MRQGISRAVSCLEWEIRVLRSKAWEVALDIRRCLSDDLQVANYRILFLFVCEEPCMVNVV